MLPKRLLATKGRWYWLIFLYLSPLAYLAGVFLIARYDLTAQTHFAYDRGKAIELAQNYAADRGFDVRGWVPFLSARFDNPRIFYYRKKSGPELDRLRALAPAIWTRVLFYSTESKGNLQVFLTPEGKPYGFSRSVPAAEPAADPGADAAKQLATSTFAHWFTPEEIASLKLIEEKTDTVGSVVVRRYQWKLPLASAPELNLNYWVNVRGDRVTREETTVSLTRDYLQSTAYGNLKFKISNDGTMTVPALITWIFYVLLVGTVFIIGFSRFIKRARQRELSYQRIVLLALLISSLFLTVILLTDVAHYDTLQTNSRANIWTIYFFGWTSYLLMGFVVAVAYGGGEGDLREGFPGKLTSLDALLKGRLFSRNVARAVVIGTAFGGWGLLASNLVPIIWINDPMAGKQISMLDFVLGRWPWMSPLVTGLFNIVFTAIVGLLLPLPFLQRRIGRKKIVIAVLAVIAWIATTSSNSDFNPWIGAAIMGIVSAALLLVPFFTFDLMTAVIALSVPSFVTSAAHLLAQPSPELRRSGFITLGIAGAILLVEIYFIYRGRTYREEEVRPLYAGYLAERLSMQAEVSAAREAQIRLLPESLPQHPRLSIAAACRPANEVGGDFYEVFDLDDDRVAVFMAEGGGKGLASALSIAYAKGFLLPKIQGDSKTDDSPIEIVRSLQSQLRRTLDQNIDMGFIYLVFDAADERIRYARTGDYPRVFIKRQNKLAPLRAPIEEEMTFTVQPSSTSTADPFTVISGMTEIESGDKIVIFTDGVATALANGKLVSAETLNREIASLETVSKPEVEKALRQLLDSADKSAHKLGLSDDLTAMVVGFGPIQATNSQKPA
jgi:serine phosphatase RsbU (regulator of sigma subunit)